MKHNGKILSWLLIVCMLLTLCLCAAAEGDLEEVSITIFDADGAVSSQSGPEPEVYSGLRVKSKSIPAGRSA